MNRFCRLLPVAGLIASLFGCSAPEPKPAPKPTPPMEPAKSINVAPDWPVYSDDNQKLVKLMQESGDKIEAERTVTYFCSFANLEDARPFSRECLGAGFKVGGERIDEGNIAVEITRVQNIRPDTVEKWSKWVYELCVKQRGEYDGWSCDPVK